MQTGKWSLTVMGLLLAGCASNRSLTEDTPRVPVYQIGDALPCRYDSMQTVVTELRDSPRSNQDYRLSVQRALGRVGAEVGADAVIVKDFVLRLPFALPGQSGPPSALRAEGTAVRWISGTCRS